MLRVSISCSVIALFTAFLPGLSKPTSWRASPTPGAAIECQRRISHAFNLFEQLQQTQRQEALEVRFTTETAYYPPGKKKLVTTASHFKLLTKAGHTYLTNGETEVYQDGQVQVSISHTQRTILITNAQHSSSTMLAQLLGMREQLKTQTLITEHHLQRSKDAVNYRVITAKPRPGSSMSTQVVSLAYWLNAQSDELHRLTMYYPLGYGPQSISLILDSQQEAKNVASISKSALYQVFDSNDRPLPRYREFALQDLRNK